MGSWIGQLRMGSWNRHFLWKNDHNPQLNFSIITRAHLGRRSNNMSCLWIGFCSRYFIQSLCMCFPQNIFLHNICWFLSLSVSFEKKCSLFVFFALKQFTYLSYNCFRLIFIPPILMIINMAVWKNYEPKANGGTAFKGASRKWIGP